MSEEDAENARAAGVEVCWVGTRLQRQAAGLDGVAGVGFEDAVPVRDFPSYRGQRHFPGMWWLATTGRHVGFESWLEREQGTRCCWTLTVMSAGWPRSRSR